MFRPTDKISLKLKGAEFFNTAVENIKISTLYTNRFFELFGLSFENETIWMKISQPQKTTEHNFQSFNLETEMIARENILQKSKLKLNEIIEFNQTHDLLQNDYILCLPLEGDFLENINYSIDLQQQIDAFQSHFYKINNATFGDLLDNNTFMSWSAAFLFRWQYMLDYLQANHILNLEEIQCCNSFFEAIKSSLNEDCLPVLINLNLDAKLYLSSFHQILGYADYTNCYWGTPEFEMAKRDFQKSIETPALKEYKQLIKNNIDSKARYFLYYVYFLLEDHIYKIIKKEQILTVNNGKNMALTLMKNALT